MKVLVLNGSPKGERSNTLNITKAFLGGFPSDTEVEFATLAKMNISNCRGCFSCWGKSKGKCVINDDMQGLYGKILAADIIIESFPLYFFGMPSIMKAMTDRCLAFMQPYMGSRTEEGKASFHEMRDNSLFEKKLVVISSCGYVDDKPMYPALKMQLDLICGEGRYTGIFCPQGELFVSPMAKRQREGYLSDIRKAGAEYAETLSISEEARKRISKPILSPSGFEAITSTHWKQQAE